MHISLCNRFFNNMENSYAINLNWNHFILFDFSRYTHRSPAQGPRSLYSVASSAKTGRSNRSRRAGARIEAMSAPNPFCPNVKGVCCLMLLLNLGLILVTLGFVIVIQFIEPLFVWCVYLKQIYKSFVVSSVNVQNFFLISTGF